MKSKNENKWTGKKEADRIERLQAKGLHRGHVINICTLCPKRENGCPWTAFTHEFRQRACTIGVLLEIRYTIPATNDEHLIQKSYARVLSNSEYLNNPDNNN